MSNVENISNPFMSIETPFENTNNSNFYEEEQKQADKAINEIRLGNSYSQDNNSRQQDYLDTFSHVASLAGEKQKIAEDYNGAMGAGVDTLQEYNVQKAMQKPSPYDFKRLEEYAPVTAEAYRNKFYDSVSMQDYLPELARAEKSYNNVFNENLYYQKQEENAGYDMLDSILASTYEGTNEILRGFKSIGVSAGSKIMNALHKTVGLAYEYIDPEQAKFLESFNLQNINEEQITQLGSWLANFWGDLDEKDYQDIIRTINKSLNDSYVAEDVLPEISLTENYAQRLANSGTVNEFIGNVAQIVPQIAVALGAGVATGGGAWAGGAAAFLTNFGMTLDSYNKDPLANKDRKELAAFMNAAAQTPLEFIGLKGIFKTFKPKFSVGIAFKDWIMGSAVEGGTEYFQSYPELIAQEFVRGKNLDEMDDVADILNILFSWEFQKDALYQGAVGAAGGGVFGSVGAIGTLQNERAKAKNLVAITSDLEYAKKYPELFKARMEEHIKKGTVPENMFVQAVKIDGLFQSVEETGITKPEIDVFLEQAGINKADYEEALKTGGTVDLPTANIPLLLETEKGTALLQDISASNVNETAGTQEVLDDLEKSKQTENADEKIFTPVDEYLLEQEYSASDEEMADYEARNAELQQQAREQEALYNNEEQDLKNNIALEIINATKNTERPYMFSEAMAFADIIDATLENISKNSGISKVGAYKRFAPHFLSRYATQAQLDETIRNIKTERSSGAANVFNPHAVTNFIRSKGYKQELAELKNAPLEELNGVYAMIKAVGDKIRITKAVTEYGEQYKEARRRMPRLFSKTQGRDYDDWRDVAKSRGYTDDLDDFGHILELIANAPTREEIIEEQKSAYMLDEEALEEQVKTNIENAEEVDPDAAYREELDFDRQEEMFFDELDEMAYQNEMVNSGDYEALYQMAEQENQSIEKVRQEYEGTDKWMKAPNGAGTKLTERQWLLVRTPEFKEWFGDWENNPKKSSQVVDENGEPLVVYHGSNAEINDDFAFDTSFIGQHGSAEGYGFYFTTDKATAEGYKVSGGSLVESFLNIRKPMPFAQKPFTKANLKKILKRAIELEIQENPDEIMDYKDSFISNYADTYSGTFDSVLSEAAELIYSGAEKATDQIADIANVSGSKDIVFQAVKDVTGFDAVTANGYSDLGMNGGQIYVAWFPKK